VTDGLHHGGRFAHDEVSIPRLTIRRWRSSRHSPSTPLLQSGGNVPPPDVTCRLSGHRNRAASPRHQSL